MINYFQVLNVSETADPEVIRAAYKTLAKKYHPDCCKIDRETAQKQMVLINQAYEVLSDDLKRAEHLRELHQSEPHRKETTSNRSSGRSQYSREPAKEPKPSSSDSNAFDQFLSDIDWADWAKILIAIVVILSIISCLFHFGPQIVRHILNSLSEEVRKITYNFHLNS